MNDSSSDKEKNYVRIKYRKGWEARFCIDELKERMREREREREREHTNERMKKRRVRKSGWGVFFVNENPGDGTTPSQRAGTAHEELEE